MDLVLGPTEVNYVIWPMAVKEGEEHTQRANDEPRRVFCRFFGNRKSNFCQKAAIPQTMNANFESEEQNWASGCVAEGARTPFATLSLQQAPNKVADPDHINAVKKAFVASALAAFSVFGRARARGLFRFLLHCAPPALCSHYLRAAPDQKSNNSCATRSPALCVCAVCVLLLFLWANTRARQSFHFCSVFFFILFESHGFYLYGNSTL